ncbi:MAG: hypothetical protein Q4C77_02790 [Eubacteriales bacterium]|nr:hypothetical protein [Eubacteriales bacterium]
MGNARNGNFSVCRKCGKQILFVRTVGGKNMPCDTKFVYYAVGGKDRIVLPNGQVVAGTILENSVGADGWGYISHFATCEFSQMFRRKKKKCVN